MIKEYLIERKNKLQEIIDINSNKYEHNKIAIEKNENQIRDLVNEVDEATNIFSVVAREDSGFKTKEIAEIEGKIAIYQSENVDLEKIINEANQELSKVKICLEELETEENNDYNEQIIVEKEQVEYIPSEKETDITKINNLEIIEKLKLCKSLICVDPMRTVIEIDNLIKKCQ